MEGQFDQSGTMHLQPSIHALMQREGDKHGTGMELLKEELREKMRREKEAEHSR